MNVRRNVTFLVVTSCWSCSARSPTRCRPATSRCSASTSRAARRSCSRRWASSSPSTLDVAIDIIRNRVDTFGTLEPEITKPGQRHRHRPPRREGSQQGDRARRQDRRAALPAGASAELPSVGAAGEGARPPPRPRAAGATTTTTAPQPSDADAQSRDRVVRRRHGRHAHDDPHHDPRRRHRATPAWCCPTSPVARTPPRYYLGKAALTGKGNVDSAKAEFQLRSGLDVKMDLTD